MKANLHTHTARCGHASGADEEYVQAAVQAGFDVLGFSDHVPWPYRSGFRHPNVRMDVTQIADYLQSVRGLRERYAGKIRILAGFEAEYFPDYISWLSDMAAENGLDYLILGNHYDRSDENGIYFGQLTTPEMLSRYVEQTARGVRTGLFTYLAHPDLFMRSWKGGYGADFRAAAKDLCQVCRDQGISMEYNMHMRYEFGTKEAAGYPCGAFFEIVQQEGIPVVTGLDAHAPEELSDGTLWDKAEKELDVLGIRRTEMPVLRGFRTK